MLLNIKCVFLFPRRLLSEKFLILRKIQRHIIINVHISARKVPNIFVRIEINSYFLDRFLKNTQIPNFMKIRPVRAELFHADSKTDRYDKANNRFSKVFGSA
jgi:hypothetical protein